VQVVEVERDQLQPLVVLVEAVLGLTVKRLMDLSILAAAAEAAVALVTAVLVLSS